ncbi:MAG: TIGR03435 family protein, partial [Acidobacteriia bacterium]|nr:TIGR03435 family protein [Terriglobia bacterium]
AAPMFLLVNQLSQAVGRKVVDRTGLQSKYDFVVEWQPDSPTFGQEPQATSDAPTSIFTALREGAGLQLKSATGPVDYIIIDKLEKPDEN